MRVVTRSGSAELGLAEVTRRVEAHSSVLVDVGTGDARRALRIARARPDTLVIGLDANREVMRDVARKAARKPAKGGVGNLALVWSSIEDAPIEIVGIADEVEVVLPWGALLEGVVHADPDVVGGIASLARGGARVVFVLNCDVWEIQGPKPIDVLPAATPELFAALADTYAECGLELEYATYMTDAELADVASSWVKRVRDHHPRARFLRVVFSRAARP